MIAALAEGAAFFHCQNRRAFATSVWTILNNHLELSLSGRRFPMSVNGSRLGRAGSCEIAINDPILSRHNCLFEYVHGDLRLTDLASANGTFVNGEELCARTIVLRHNDVITVGLNTVKVKYQRDRLCLSRKHEIFDYTVLMRLHYNIRV